MISNFLFEDKNSIDSLTGVYNRAVLVEYINFLVANDVPFSLAIVDIDNFKYVNDTYGHPSGDKILIEVSSRLKEIVGDSGTVGRFGGDEFLIVYPEISSYEDIWKKCRNIMKMMNNFEIKEFQGLFITVTIGVSRFPEDDKNYEGLLEIADKALYFGKNKGRNCFIIYSLEKHAGIQLRGKKDKTLSSMYLHAMVFRFLTKSSDIYDGILSLFNFLSSYYAIDHLCLQKGDKIICQKIHNLALSNQFLPLNLRLVEDNLSASTEFFYVNHLESLISSNQMELCSQYVAQNIKAAFCCKIFEDDDGEVFVLRVESTSERIWQHGEMDIYITATKIIGMLYQDGKFAI